MICFCLLAAVCLADRTIACDIAQSFLDIEGRDAEEFKPIHVLNMETTDNNEDALKKAEALLRLCSLVSASSSPSQGSEQMVSTSWGERIGQECLMGRYSGFLTVNESFVSDRSVFQKHLVRLKIHWPVEYFRVGRGNALHGIRRRA